MSVIKDAGQAGSRHNKKVNAILPLIGDEKNLLRMIRESEILKNGMGDMPRVVVCGLLKSGKSSLLNALTTELRPEYFATGATRVTDQVKTLEKNSLLWIDTPGIDASQQDDTTAWEGIVMADIPLFVHSLAVATLDRQEKEFLEELVRRDPTAPERMLVSMTNCDTIAPEQEKRVTESLQQEILTILGTTVPFVYTSFPRFKKGTLENKEVLVKKSGMAQLHREIGTRAANTVISREKRLNVQNELVGAEFERIVRNRRADMKSMKLARKNQNNKLKKELELFAGRAGRKIRDLESRYA